MPAIDRGPAASRPAQTPLWLDPLVDPRWSALTEHHPNASVFHSRGWLEALKRTYGYDPVVLALEAPAGDLTGALVFCRVSSRVTGRRLVSLPFSDHCDPLVASGSELERLVAAACEAQHRGDVRYVEWRPTVSDAADLPSRYCLHRVDLSVGEAALVRSFHKNHVLRKIRRSEREQLEYAEGSSDRLLDAFYGLLIKTRRRHGMPPQPRRWFRNILDCLPGVAKIRVAYAGTRPVAAILSMTGRHAMMFKYGASDVRFHPLGGVHMLLWHTMQEAMRLGCRTFDFGRSDMDNTGLIAFKEHWGATGTPLVYARYPRSGGGTVVDAGGRALARGFARFAPDWLLVAGGSAIYPHLG